MHLVLAAITNYRPIPAALFGRENIDDVLRIRTERNITRQRDSGIQRHQVGRGGRAHRPIGVEIILWHERPVELRRARRIHDLADLS